MYFLFTTAKIQFNILYLLFDTLVVLLFPYAQIEIHFTFSVLHK